MRKLKKEFTVLPHTLDAYECVKKRLEDGAKKTCYLAATGIKKFHLALLVMRDNPDKDILFVTSAKANAHKSQDEAELFFEDTSNITFEIYANLCNLVNQKYDIIILDEFHRTGAPLWNDYVLYVLNNNPQAIVIGFLTSPVRYLDDNRNVAWEDLYQCAKAYCEERGNLLVPHNCSVDGFKLGRWISKQRQSYKQGTLPDDKIALLESIGMVWNQFEDNWQTNYQYAKNYYEAHGNLHIPHRYSVDGFKLGIWISAQRNSYKQGTLPANKVSLLESIGMVWKIRNKDQWQTGYEHAKSYYKEYGNLLVPHNCSIDGFNLGMWINNQRHSYKQGKLSDDKVTLLESIGMVWKIRNKGKWQTRYEHAKSYYKEYGNLLVPHNCSIDGFNLGIWINNQRQYYKQGKLSDDKVSLLESIGMVWNQFEDNWQTMYQYAKNYYEAHGNLHIPHSYSIDGFNLGVWISKQRYSYKQGKLSDDKVSLLESIGMAWNQFEEKWQTSYQYAKNYYEAHGNLHIPHSYFIDGFNLGRWIQTQRQSYKKGTLTDDKISLLKSISMVWDSLSDNV